MAPPPTKLAQVSIEGFMLLEKLERRNGRKIGQTHHIHVHPQKEKVIDSFEAARIYNGLVICEHRDKRQSAIVCVVMRFAEGPRIVTCIGSISIMLLRVVESSSDQVPDHHGSPLITKVRGSHCGGLSKGCRTSRNHIVICRGPHCN